MLCNRKLILDTFCEVYDLLLPYADDKFWTFEDIEVQSGAIYVIGRAQFNLNVAKIREIIKHKQAIIILSNPAEGSETLKHHVQRLELVDEAIDGSLLLLGGGDMESHYCYMQYDSFLPKVYDYTENIEETNRIEEIYQKLDKPYKFLFLNGRTRPHRKFLIKSLELEGLLDTALWTNLDTSQGITKNIQLVKDGINYLADTIPIKTLPIEYEVSRYQTNVANLNTDEKFVKSKLFAYDDKLEWGDIYIRAELYIDTYFSIVTDTIFTYPYSFRTEKIWKPIAMGHPWIAVSNYGYYKDLRNLGFKTYHSIIDESFDLIRNDQDRLNTIKHVIIDLCKSDLINFLSQCKEVSLYNQQHLYIMRDKVRKEFPGRFIDFLRKFGVGNG